MRPFPFSNASRGGVVAFAGMDMDGVFARLEKGYGCVAVAINLAPVRTVGSAFAHLRSELDSMRASKSEC